MRRFTGLALTLLALAIGFAPISRAIAEEPEAWGLWTLPPVSPLMVEIENFHNLVSVIILVIVIVVFGLLGYAMYRFRASANPVPQRFAHNTTLEVVWTLIPVIILVGIAFPSFKLLYAESRVKDADITLKVTGHQWYWSYEYPDLKVSYDSNLVQDSDLKPGQPRLLTVDKPIYLPVGKVVRILVTSQDVIHSFSIVPAGVKDDAVPGRTNETWTRIDKPGVYYGQCSQLCGVNHGYMPIEVHAVSDAEFQTWVNSNKKAEADTGTKFAAAAASQSQR